MIGKIIGAFAGSKVAQTTSGMGGPMGAALGVVATTLVKRMSIPAMMALAAGGYVAKKLSDKGKAEPASRLINDPPANTVAPATAKKAAAPKQPATKIPPAKAQV